MALISIFNGYQRTLGEPNEAETRVFVQVDVRLLEVLRMFRGAPLSVLMALALRANERGWAWPSVETLMRDTGLSRNTVFRALDYLCQLRINGQRVLLRARLRDPESGTLGTNCYLLFPTPAEEKEYDSAELSEHPEATYQKVVRGPRTTFTNVVKLHPNNKHDQTITMEEEKKEEEKKDKRNEIAQVLQEHGVFPENAARIAVQMAASGLSPEDARDIFLETLQAVAQRAVPDEQAIARAVYRLEKGVWDAGERAREALRRARYTAHSSPDATPDTVFPNPAGSSRDIWQAALGELQLELPRATFETWLRPTRLIACEDGTFVISVANSYAKDWLESRLRPVVLRTLARLTGRDAREISVQFVEEHPVQAV